MRKALLFALMISLCAALAGCGRQAAEEEAEELQLRYQTLRAAETDVNSSGRDVPSATMVNPINRSLIPKTRAMALAASTVKLLPKITKKSPPTVSKPKIHPFF